jgi:L-ribulose-5-phosphate 3-epimerase
MQHDEAKFQITRRQILATGAAFGAASLIAPSTALAAAAAPRSKFKISLAQWSLHKLFYAGDIDNLDFAQEAHDMGFGAIEYVNGFFKDKAGDDAYLADMDTRAKDNGLVQLLIMCDGEGKLGDPDDAARTTAINNHKKWLETAQRFGCHSIRVNAASAGSYEEQQKLAADGLSRLTEMAESYSINVIVENHGGYSSNGEWLSGVMKMVDKPTCGTLPDFGNFCMDWGKQDDPDSWYDRYKGVGELMPFAKAVSAKSHEFDEHGDETKTDYYKMLKIVLDSGYKGWVGVEYEGSKHPPREGCTLTKALLTKIAEGD